MKIFQGTTEQEHGGSDPIFRAARELGRRRLGGGRFDRFWLVAFSALAISAPAFGLYILQGCLSPTGRPPSSLVGDAKRAFLLEKPRFSALAASAGEASVSHASRSALVESHPSRWGMLERGTSRRGTRLAAAIPSP